jgi:hypothetical protein
MPMKAKYVGIAIVLAAVAWLAWTNGGWQAPPDAPPPETSASDAMRAPAPTPRAATQSQDSGNAAASRKAPTATPPLAEFHFEDESGTPIDLDATHALARWQPGEHKLRVLLANRELSADETAVLLGVATGGSRAIPAGHAVIELTFLPTAQAFDRNDLDTAVLTVTSAAGASASADILASLDWQGSLPSAQTAAEAGAGARPNLELKAAGARDNGDPPRSSSWKLDASIPVTIAD